MNQMAPEQPAPEEGDQVGEAVDLEVDYEWDSPVLLVNCSRGGASIQVMLDWSDGKPGEDFNFLHEVMPTVIARVHQEVNGA